MFKIYEHECFACLCGCMPHACLPGAQSGQKKAADLLGLGLERVVSHVGAANQTPVLHRNKRSSLLSLSSTGRQHF